MRSRHRRFIGSMALAMVAMALALVLWPVARASAAEFEIYVSDEGSDESGNGTKEFPYASLAKAVEQAGDGATVYVMSNLEMTKCARLVDKNLTIKSLDGERFIVTRGENFEPIQDTRRSTYNPAMFEVTMPSAESSLRIENLIIDDCGTYEGSHFIPAEEEGSTNGISNTDIVQDSIIALYSRDGKEGSVTLGAGTVLHNFGGMSAVNVSGGTLTMEAGSLIEDSTVTDRTKQSEDYGAAGAVWCRGGSFTMEKGASIKNVCGRALYVDNEGSATINGEISNIACDNEMWQGDAGAAVHVRGKSNVVLGSGGIISNITQGDCITKDNTPRAVEADSANFTAMEGSNIQDCRNVMVLHASSANDNYAHKILINGTISGNSGKYSLARSYYGLIELGETGIIENNITTSDGGLLYSNNGSHYIIRGKIVRNTATAGMLYVANYSGGVSEATIEDGALIANNTGLGVRNNSGTTVTMNGGEISNNTGGNVRISGKTNYADVHFIMNGGKISSNNGAFNIEFTGTNGANCDLNAGTVECSSDGPSVIVIRGNAHNAAERVSIAAGVLQGNRTVEFSTSMPSATVTVSDPVKLGTPQENCKDKAANKFEGLTSVKGSFWYKGSPDAQVFSISGLSYDSTKPLYAAVMATGEDGKAADNAVVSLQAIETDADNGSFSLSLPGESATGYAVVFLQQAPDNPDAKVVTVTPVDVTVYEGGKGYTAVVDGSETTTNNSMPHPLFTIKGVEDANGLTFSNGTGGKTWTAVLDGTNSDGTNNYYHFEPSPGNDQGDVRVTYTNAAGKTVTSDEFNVTSAGNTFEQFTIGLYLGENNLAHIIASNSSDNYAVALGTGTLTVRAIQANNPDTVVSEVISQGSLESQKSGEAVAVAPVSTTYTLNDTAVKLPKDAKPSLLFDDIIDEDGHERTSALVDAIEEKFGSTVDEGCYQAKYLDLVDAKNSNAWIKASGNVTVYWGYPEGTDKSTDFKLYHFEGLHRDGANSGYDVSDINTAEIKPVKVENTEKGIAFTVESGGFSPFVLVWQKDSGGSVTPPAATHTITATAGSGGSISPSGKVAVTEGTDQAFTITPDEGNKVRDVAIDGKSVGALGSYTFEDVRGDHTISVTFTRGNAPADPDDTGVSDWFETGDHDAFMHGYDDGTGRFGPDDNMTRGEAAQMFYNMLRDKSRGDVRFDFEDLSEGAWYYEAVATMASHGILLGTSPTTVEPERPITRAEFTAMAMRFSKGDLSGENIFTDVSEGDWYYGVVVGSIKYGWISGYDDGTGRFGPNDEITRAQATTIANRMLGRVADGVFVSAHLDEIRRFPDVDEGFYAFLDIAEATNSHDYARDGGFEHWSALR